jgi:protein associated with RNAse G/E
MSLTPYQCPELPKNMEYIMKNIKDYHPHKGFYDLREFKLSKKTFLKLWDIQEYLNHVNERKEYYRTIDTMTWRKAQELSSYYQLYLITGDRNE